ncbi:DUF551 domain-containing protein [Edwardsiella piscicida]|uniref:DUF551 domain-containing protein n=1 Tax=Edwardsiella piscicida TaxID=1263550 RepID=UPI000D509D17|nr:DUF551 domain-containing protein [Edwardsiella piscicida]QBB13892.1 DUF551 domain-containing protein [Edwardsiella piscicida]UCQ29759.1 DUF551 domain-containing protein [Edwardsiella piscicida]
MNMREEFEKWLSNCLGPFVDMSRDEYGIYQLQDVRLAWLAWNAAQPKWIECSEPPEKSSAVLLIDSNGVVLTGAYFQTSGFILDIGDKGKSEFTHWIPLPNPPEE